MTTRTRSRPRSARRAATDEFATFCAREHGRLVGALSLYLGDAAVAEELAQEALIRADHRWSQVRRMDRPGAWLVTVGMNLARSHVRRVMAERRARARHGAPDDVHRDPDTPTRLAVREAVAALPHRQREVVVLRYFLDLDVATTAGMLDASPSAVTSLTNRALEALRQRSGLDLDATEARRA